MDLLTRILRGNVAAWTLLIVLAMTSAATSADTEDPFVSIVDQGSEGVTLAVRFPIADLTLETDADGNPRAAVRGLGSIPRTGYPDLPVLVTSVGVPEGVEVRVSWTSESSRVTPASSTRQTLGVPSDDEINDLWPTQVVTHEIVQFRELRIARLQIHPVRYRSASGEIEFNESITIHVEFAGVGEFRRVQGRMATFAEQLVARHLVNSDTVRAGWSVSARRNTRTTPTPEVLPEKSAVGANPGVKIRVDTEGLVRITRAELEAAGFNPAPVDPRQLELSYRGIPVPCRIVGEADGSFDIDDYIEFYGIPADTRFAADNIYWLEETAAPAPRFPTRDATPGMAPLVTEFPHTEHFEPSNSVYTVGHPAEEGDPHFYWAWFENNTAPPRVTTLTHNATLPGLGSGTDATFRAFFRGRTDPPEDPDHKVRFRVNGTIVGEPTWNGMTFHTAEIPFSRSLLNTGSNAFRVEWRSIAVPDIYYMDWIEIAYSRVTQAVSDRLTITSAGGDERFEVTGFGLATDPLILDVTDPFAPTLLTSAVVSGAGPFTVAFENTAVAGDRIHVVTDGGRLTASSIELDVPSDLRNPANGADLLIVAPPGWQAELAPLIDQREFQGLRVLATNLVDVADEFGGGNSDDTVIRDFVKYAYENYAAPPPAFLLLVGEPNVDPRNWLEQDPFSHMMPIHFAVTDAQGETISDTWFGAVVGDDLLPDVAVARFSVRDTQQLSDLVSKTLGYDQNPPDGAPWGSRIVQIASAEQRFEDAQESSAAVLPPEYVVDQQYRRDGASGTSIRNAIDAGALVTSFVGHGNVGVWADSPGGVFWAAANVTSLSNTNRLTVITALNCLNGLIGDPYTPSALAEHFHNKPTTGAIAVWSPSALGFLRQFNELQQVFYETLFVDRVPELGTVTTGSLVEAFLTRPSSINLVKEMILLGDPSSRIAIDCDTVDVTCDGVDDDCDGERDEEFTSQTSFCGVGACVSSGTTACDDSVFSDSCVPGEPAADDADCDDVDDDCDGLADDDFPNESTSCGVGACATTGQTQCVGGAVEDTCTPGDPAPNDPTCDGSDDDCDEATDEDYSPQPTACGLGICVAAGITSCVDGTVLDSCTPGGPEASDATCDGIDQNCDGISDDEYPVVPTSCGVGACASEGLLTCNEATEQDSCTPGGPAANDLTCDGIDDDCDGLVDEDFAPQQTVCGLGPCAATGVTACVDGVVEDSCTPGMPAAHDESCNGIDDDCNGVPDDGFVSRPSICGVGACQGAGETLCIDGVFQDTCVEDVAHSELCDGIDNDCDGSTDEDDAINAPTWYRDLDGDGFGTNQESVRACAAPQGFVLPATDCDDGNATVWAIPGEIGTLGFEPDRVSIDWEPPVDPGGAITTYLVRSANPMGFSAGDGAECIDADSATSASDPTTPRPGALLYYLARAENACPAGVGILGYDSEGIERSGRTCPAP